MNLLNTHMMTDTFDFQEALSCIEADMPVCLTLGGVKRTYFIKDGEIVCTPNDKEHLTYKVKHFQIDAVMSKEWRLCQ